MKKVLSLFLAIVMMMGIVAMFPVQASAEEPVAVVANNVEFNQKLHMMYAVSGIQAGDAVTVKLYANGEEMGFANEYGTVELNGVNCVIYTADDGIALQDIATVITAEVWVNNAKATESSRSILDWLNKKIIVDQVTGDEKNLYLSLLDTVGYLQPILKNTNNVDSDFINKYSYVNVTNATVNGGNAAMLAHGTALGDVLATDLEPAAGEKIQWTVVEYDDDGTEGITYTTDDIQSVKIEDGVNLILDAEVVEDLGEVAKKTVSFAMGNDGSATHKDGSTDKTSYTETVDGYTLNLTSGSKMYPNSFDATGNGCIKFGAKSSAGKFTLVVGDDVTKVTIHVAGYKDDNAKVTINGTTHTITTLSNNGDYTAIEIDTSSVKTITFTTVSGGWRAMINQIDFEVPDNG